MGGTLESVSLAWRGVAGSTSSQTLTVSEKEVAHALHTFHTIVSLFGLVSAPDPTFNTARGKGGLVNIVQNTCRSAEFRWDNLIG